MEKHEMKYALARLPGKKKQLLGMALPILLLVILLFYLLRDAELTKLAEISRQVDPRYLLAGVAAIIIFFCCEAVGLHLLLNGKRRGLSRPRCYAYSLIDFYFSSITPACCGGQPAQLCYLQRDGVRVGAAAPALLCFNLFYHIAVLLIAGCALLISGGIPVGSGIARWMLYYGIAAQFLVGSFFLLAIFSKQLLPSIVNAAVQLLTKLRILRQPEKTRAILARQLAEYREGAAYLRQRPWLLLVTLPLLIVHLSALYSLPFWVSRAFGLTNGSFFSLLAMQAILTLAVESLPIPGGAGVAEGGFLLLYRNIFGAELLLPALLLIRGLNYYLPLLAGGLTAALLQPRRPRALAARRNLGRMSATR